MQGINGGFFSVSDVIVFVFSSLCNIKGQQATVTII